MRRGFFSSTILMLLLALSAWGGASPRVWCLGPDGHIALESAFSECCAPLRGNCSSSQPPPITGVLATGAEAGPEVISAYTGVGGDPCVDSSHQFSSTRSGARASALALPILAAASPLPQPTRQPRPFVPWTGFAGLPLHHPTPYQLRTLLLI